MWSRRPRVARPVRIVAISCCRSASAFSMRVLTFVSTSLTDMNVVAAGAADGSVFMRRSPNRHYTMRRRYPWRMDSIEHAAQHLVDARQARRRGERIPEAFRPRDIPAALA